MGRHARRWTLEEMGKNPWEDRQEDGVITLFDVEQSNLAARIIEV